MTNPVRVVLIAAITAVSFPAAAYGQQPTIESLQRRVDSLERQNVFLVRQLAELQYRLKFGAAPPPAAASANSSPALWKDLANWHRLRKGMSMDSVEALLGKPASTRTAGTYLIWEYGIDTNVMFYPKLVYGWTEPKR